MNTLQLTPAWDLAIDSTGNIGMESGAAAIAQDVASAISTILGEVFYDTTLGIPYLSDVLGQAYSPSILQALLAQAALGVPGVVSARATITQFQARAVTGTVTVTDSDGRTVTVTF